MKEPGYSDLAILNSKGTDVITDCRLGLTAFSKIFDFVKNVWFPITQQKQKKENKKEHLGCNFLHNDKIL